MLKMHPIEIFTCNSTAHHILENLSQCFLSNVLNFHGNTLLQLFDGGWSGKNFIFLMPPREKIQWGWSVLRGGHSPMETSLPLKNLCKNSMVCSDILAQAPSC